MLDKKVLEKFNKEQEKLIGIIVRKDSLIAGVTYEKLLESLEKETVYLRQLISMCSSGFKEQCNLPDNKYDITIKSEQHNGKRRYILELPFLLPNRRSSKTNFKRTIVSDTHHSILEYCKKVHPKMIRNASVTFINYYAPSVHRKLRHNKTHRLDPKCYSDRFLKIIDCLNKSCYKTHKLKDLITNYISGDWGKSSEVPMYLQMKN